MNNYLEQTSYLWGDMGETDRFYKAPENQLVKEIRMKPNDNSWDVDEEIQRPEQTEETEVFTSSWGVISNNIVIDTIIGGGTDDRDNNYVGRRPNRRKQAALLRTATITYFNIPKISRNKYNN